MSFHYPAYCAEAYSAAAAGPCSTETSAACPSAAESGDTFHNPTDCAEAHSAAAAGARSTETSDADSSAVE